MTVGAKPRLVWFDANRVCAAVGVVLIHSATDFGGQAFADAPQSARHARFATLTRRVFRI